MPVVSGPHFQKFRKKNHQECFCWDDLRHQRCDTDARTYFYLLESLVAEVKMILAEVAHFHFCLNSNREY